MCPKQAGRTSPSWRYSPRPFSLVPRQPAFPSSQQCNSLQNNPLRIPSPHPSSLPANRLQIRHTFPAPSIGPSPRTPHDRSDVLNTAPAFSITRLPASRFPGQVTLSPSVHPWRPLLRSLPTQRPRAAQNSGPRGNANVTSGVTFGAYSVTKIRLTQGLLTVE